MDFLRLLLGLFLPWAGAYLWLCAAENRFSDQSAHRCRQLGYAYFLGLMVVFGLLQVQSWVSGSVSYWLTISMLAVFTLTGLIVYRTTTPKPFLDSGQDRRLQLCLLWVFASGCVLHLVLAGIEIWHRPVFPWDAWQTWIYRAKAWFHAGAILPLDNPIAWEFGNGVSSYSAAGADYPLFVSAIAFWTALSLNRWHDALVNLPTLLCGIALALSMYGLARESALPRWLSALGAYFLLSIPLLSTHLALAGQADIWQTAYTGLGLAALLGGIIGARHWLTALGLSMALIGVLVKNEGFIWFLTALALFGLSRHPRWILYSAALVATLALVAWVTGVHYLELPGLGAIGVADGRAYIPWLGSYQIMTFDLWDDYRTNFFQSSTWHVLWPMLLLAALGLLKLPDRNARNTILILAFLLVLSQIVIFVFSEHGQWAEDWTAINRLPLHVAPLAVFALLIIYSRLAGGIPGHASGIRQWLASGAGLAITLTLCMLYLTNLYPSTHGEPEEFSAAQLSIVVGSGYLEDKTGVINSFENGIAIVSSGQTAIDAFRLPVLEVTTSGPNRSPRRFFWRNGPAEEDLHSIDIDRGGTERIHLGSYEHWQGEVSELGLLLYEDDDRRTEVRSISLRPQTLSGMLTITWQDWTAMSNWNQGSVNFASAGETPSPLNLTVVLTAWITVTTLLALLFKQLLPVPQRGIALTALLAWLLLDLRWTSELIARAVSTTAYYRAEPANHLDLGNDKALMRLAERARPYLDHDRTPLLVVGESDNLDFETLRTKYHLLPLGAHVMRGATLSSPTRFAADHVLVIRTPALAPGQRRAGAGHFSTALSELLGRSYVSVFEDPSGVLLKATRENMSTK